MSMFCKIVGPSSDIHKLPEVPKTFKELQAVVHKKFSHDLPEKFSLKYKDSDDELITLCNDEDLQTAVITSQSENQKTLRIFVFPDTNPQNNKEGKTLSIPVQASPSKPEITEKPSSVEKENFIEEPYVGQLDYISSDPGKLPDESADLRKIIDQLPQTLDFRRSMSHNPQVELGKFQENQENGRHFDGREMFGGAPPRLVSPGLPEEILVNDYFNEEQMKIIAGIVEQKVGEKIEDKISNFSNEILARFQEEVRSMGMGRSMTGFGMKGMGMPYGSRMMGIRRNKEAQEDEIGKDCSNCNHKIVGIKYNCLTCRNFTCCENCENTINHEHPLLKIRPGKIVDLPKAENIAPAEDYTGPAIDMSSSTRLPARPANNMFNKMNSSANISPQVTGSQATNNRDIKKGNTESMSTSAYSGRIDNVATLPIGRLSTTSFNNSKDVYSYNGSETPSQQNKALFKSATMDIKSPHLKPNNNPRPSEFKQYKVALVKPPLYEVTTVKAGHPYNINFTIKNNGDIKWSDDTKLICVEGIHKGDDLDLPALSPGNTYIVDLHLQSPWELGRFFNEWKVHYLKDGAMKPFGKEISIEIEVVDSDKMDKERAKKDRLEKPAHVEKEARGSLHADKGSHGDDDKKLMKEFGCSEDVLKHAKVLQDLMCTGSLKEKIDFIKCCPREWNLNQIVSAYLNSPTKLKDMAAGFPTLQ